jgi:hypothetical protein
MPTPELIFSAALFAVSGMVLALVTARMAPARRRAMLYMVLVMTAGVLGLVALGKFSDASAGMTIVIVLREIALLLVAIGIALVFLAFLFQALLAK